MFEQIWQNMLRLKHFMVTGQEGRASASPPTAEFKQTLSMENSGILHVCIGPWLHSSDISTKPSLVTVFVSCASRWTRAIGDAITINRSCRNEDASTWPTGRHNCPKDHIAAERTVVKFGVRWSMSSRTSIPALFKVLFLFELVGNTGKCGMLESLMATTDMWTMCKRIPSDPSQLWSEQLRDGGVISQWSTKYWNGQTAVTWPQATPSLRCSNPS